MSGYYREEVFEVVSPKISVIIPIYKVEAYLCQCLDSVINQTYRNLQIILVDDGSPDNCGVICDEYAASDDRIVVIHKKNGGVSSARNAGLTVADGEWIYFIDPDDWIEPNTLAVCIQKALDRHVDMVIFESDRFDDTKEFTTPVSWIKKSDEDILYNDLQASDSLTRFMSRGSVCISIVKKNAIKADIFFDEELYVGEDGDFKWKLYPCIDSFLYTPCVFYHYRITPNSAYNNSDVVRKITGLISKHKKIREKIIAGEYPANALDLNNSITYQDFIFILTGNMFNNTSLPYMQKREIISTVVNTDVFKEVSTHCNRSYLGFAAKIFLKFKRFPIFVIYLIHYLKKLQAAVRTIRSNVRE